METKKYQLPNEFATRWVEALRSGNYAQTSVCLCKEGSYCCLGVALSMQGVDDDKLSTAQWIAPAKISPYGFSDNDPVLTLVPELLIGDDDNDFVSTVAEMNDDGKSFYEIADWLENNVQFI